MNLKVYLDMKNKKIKIFLGAFLNYTNAQNINCLSLSNHLDQKKFTVYSLSVYFRPKVKSNAIIFNCLYPFKISSKLGLLWGILVCDIAYFPKHQSTPKWMLKIANFLGKKTFTTIEANMCDFSKERSMIKAFKGKRKMINYFKSFKNIFPITTYLRDNSKCGVNIDDRVLFLGVENCNFNPVVKQRLKNIIFIGTVEEAKGIHEYNELSKLYNNLNFHAIGDGPLKKTLENDINNRINFYGLLDNDKLDAILENIDLLILPSKAEGFPKVILEAASAGVPSIVYSDYGANEWILNNDSGFVVNTFEQIKESLDLLLKNQSEIKKRSINAIKLSKNYDWKYIIKDWEKIISSLS